MKNKFVILGLLLSVFCLVGCDKGGVKVLDVQGKLTIDGKPIEGVSVTFSPKDKTLRAAAGLTEADGTFRVVTPGAQKAGVMPGEYVITFKKQEQVSVIDGTPSKDIPYDPTVPSPELKTVDYLPLEWGDPQLSPHAVKIESKNTPLDFNLETEK